MFQCPMDQGLTTFWLLYYSCFSYSWSCLAMYYSWLYILTGYVLRLNLTVDPDWLCFTVDCRSWLDVLKFTIDPDWLYFYSWLWLLVWQRTPLARSHKVSSQWLDPRHDIRELTHGTELCSWWVAAINNLIVLVEFTSNID